MRPKALSATFSLACIAFMLAAFGQGCAGCGQHAVCSLNGPINDPSNRTLRRSIMSFGLGEFCKQMIQRNAPLKLGDDQPVIGRFYPKGCRQKELDNGDLYVEFDGQGYAWTMPTRKMSFFAGATITYNQDFQCDDDDDMYAYFPPRMPIPPPQFRKIAIEQPLVDLIPAQLGNTMGTTLLQSKLGQGFTVIREPNGNTDFNLGMQAKGTRPVHPFSTKGGEKFTYENLRTEVHRAEHDFVGPIAIEGGGKALYISANIDGATRLGVLVMPADEAEPLLNAYIAQGPANPIVPSRGEPWTGIAQQSIPYQRVLPVPPGAYYVIFDNNPQLNPPAGLLDDRAASISYLIQIGDAP